MVTKQIGLNYHKHFRRDPKICGWQLIIKRTRVPVRIILASLAEGSSVDEFLVDFPTLREVDVKGVQYIQSLAGSNMSNLQYGKSP